MRRPKVLPSHGSSLAGVVGDLHLDAERRMALLHLHVEARVAGESGVFRLEEQSEPSGLISVMPQAWMTSTP